MRIVIWIILIVDTLSRIVSLLRLGMLVRLVIWIGLETFVIWISANTLLIYVWTGGIGIIFDLVRSVIVVRLVKHFRCSTLLGYVRQGRWGMVYINKLR